MLIVFVAIAVLGVTTFIIQRLSQNEANEIKTGCIYLAQAGAHDAIYWYRYHDLAFPGNGYFSLGRIDIDSDNFFVLGGTAGNLLMVNTSSSYLWPPWPSLPGKGNYVLRGLSMQNATNSKTITIERMIVTWNNNSTLKHISIGGIRVWSGDEPSPADCDITDFTLDTIPTIYDIDHLFFSYDMGGATISIEFVMSDDTRRALVVYPPSENYSFTVKSTGKTTRSDIYRTVQADYNALTAKITRYDEIDTEITP